MELFGPDFKRAKTEWLYPREKEQLFWRAFGLFIALVLLDGVLQIAGGFGAYTLIYGHGLKQFLLEMSVAAPTIMKSSIIGLLPSAILLIICALYFSQFGMPKRQGRLKLEFPKLGVLGWLSLIIGFAIVIGIIFNGAFAALGIDPETYSSAGGLSDPTNSSGLVEKTMAELSNEPMLFALALPGVVLAAPLTEELIFRGAIFSALASSPVGRIGAVIITSAAWALIHLTAAPWLFVGIIFIMGLVLGTLLLRFGSLWVTIACHTAWNTISSLAIFGLGTHH
jgi:uncharacterized protein